MTRKLVVEADGGSRGNPGPAGYGALVRDPSTGEVLAEVCDSLGTATNNVAEYSGLVAGLRAAAQLAPGADAEVRMDSKLVVEQMSGRWQIKHDNLRTLARTAREAASRLGRVSYVWVPRARNADADKLANKAMDAAERGPAAEEGDQRGKAVRAWFPPTRRRRSRMKEQDDPRAGSRNAGRRPLRCCCGMVRRHCR